MKWSMFACLVVAFGLSAQAHSGANCTVFHEKGDCDWNNPHTHNADGTTDWGTNTDGADDAWQFSIEKPSFIIVPSFNVLECRVDELIEAARAVMNDLDNNTMTHADIMSEAARLREFANFVEARERNRQALRDALESCDWAVDTSLKSDE